MNQKRCSHCNGSCTRKGKSRGIQRYKCADCNRYEQASYLTKRRNAIDISLLLLLHREGMGISSISRVLGVSKSTVQRKILLLAAATPIPETREYGQEYEVDELRTYVGSKRQECWVMYAINQKTKRVICMTTGRRTKSNLKIIIDELLLLHPGRIYTDGLNTYRSLIPPQLHRRSPGILAYIERRNLNLRTHLKRLNRKTICFTKSERMLHASVKIYFFG